MNNKIYNVNELKDIIIPILEPLGVFKISLFGSYAKGEATKSSDIDLLVHLPDTFDIMTYMKAEKSLKKSLGKDIDILEYRCIVAYMKDSILEGSLVIYDKG